MDLGTVSLGEGREMFSNGALPASQLCKVSFYAFLCILMNRLEASEAETSKAESPLNVGHKMPNSSGWKC